MAHPHPSSLLVEDPNHDGDLWIECKTCGRCNYQSKLRKGLLDHKRGCKTAAQYSLHSTTPAPQLEQEIQSHLRDQELREFSNNVRRTGLTHGRDDDVLEAVRKGYLSDSDAMNTDD